MRISLDTHVFFWWMAQDANLLVAHRNLIENNANVGYVSAVSGWEVAIKVKIGKWPEAAPLLPDLSSKIVAAGFHLLPLTLSQAERAGSLDLTHRDPFDRMLAAQAIELDIDLASSDVNIARLGCRVV
jgi:PIN domain nuclease of toxin-antitoxin system